MQNLSAQIREFTVLNKFAQVCQARFDRVRDLSDEHQDSIHDRFLELEASLQKQICYELTEAEERLGALERRKMKIHLQHCTGNAFPTEIAIACPLLQDEAALRWIKNWIGVREVLGLGTDLLAENVGKKVHEDAMLLGVLEAERSNGIHDNDLRKNRDTALSKSYKDAAWIVIGVIHEGRRFSRCQPLRAVRASAGVNIIELCFSRSFVHRMASTTMSCKKEQAQCCRSDCSCKV